MPFRMSGKQAIYGMQIIVLKYFVNHSSFGFIKRGLSQYLSANFFSSPVNELKNQVSYSDSLLFFINGMAVCPLSVSFSYFSLKPLRGPISTKLCIWVKGIQMFSKERLIPFSQGEIMVKK